MSARTAFTAVGLAGMVAGMGLAVLPATGAAAATCTHPSWSNKDSRTGKVTSSTWVGVQTGPNAGCPVEVYVSSLNVLNYDCYTVNSASHTWTHVTTGTGRKVGCTTPASTTAARWCTAESVTARARGPTPARPGFAMGDRDALGGNGSRAEWNLPARGATFFRGRT